MTPEQIRVHRALHWLDSELRHHAGAELVPPLGAHPDEYVLFGSVVLFLHGYRETIGDLDVFVSRRIWDVWDGSAGWEREAPREDDPPYLASWTNPSVSAFYAWSERDEWIDVADCFAGAEVVNGWRCITLELVREHKRNAGAALGFDGPRAKHLDDLAVLDAVLP